MNKILRYYRPLVIGFILATQLVEQVTQIINCDAGLCLARNKNLTIQVNYAAAIWLLLNLINQGDQVLLNKLKGKIHGGLTVYMVFVTVAYHVLLSSGDPYFWTFTNLSQHYIAPILFLLDWFISNDVSYDYSFLKSWLIYPSLYLVFALTNGVLGLSSNTGSSYIYGFLNFQEFGFIPVLIVVIAVYVLLITLSVLSIFLSKKLNNEIN